MLRGKCDKPSCGLQDGNNTHFSAEGAALEFVELEGFLRAREGRCLPRLTKHLAVGPQDRVLGRHVVHPAKLCNIFMSLEARAPRNGSRRRRAVTAALEAPNALACAPFRRKTRDGCSGSKTCNDTESCGRRIDRASRRHRESSCGLLPSELDHLLLDGLRRVFHRGLIYLRITRGPI